MSTIVVHEERYDAGELLRLARHHLTTHSHTAPSSLRYGSSLSTPDLIYYMAKHIERTDLALDACKALRLGDLDEANRLADEAIKR